MRRSLFPRTERNKIMIIEMSGLDSSKKARTLNGKQI
jgi:hypothetical protein